MSEHRCLQAYVGGLVHEANAFSPIATPLQSFRRYDAQTPLTVGSADATAISDFIDAVAATGDRAHRGVFAIAEPSAPAAAEDYATLRDTLLADIAARPAVNAVLLFLHGAQTAAGEPDCAGDVVQRIRRQQGKDCRIGVVLDLHANITPRLLNNATLVACCKHYPHTDQGTIAAQLWFELRRSWDLRLCAHWLPVPCFPAATTTKPPMAALVSALTAMEADAEVLLASAAHGFPQADVTHASAGILLYTRMAATLDDALGKRIQRLGTLFLELAIEAARLNPAYSMAEALERAAALEGPVLIAERSDNPGAGGSADVTGLLHALRADGRFSKRRVGVALLYDPVAVTAAVIGGPGSTLAGPVAGNLAQDFGAPLPGPFRVVATTSNLEQPLFGSGGTCSLGPSALLQADNLWLLLTSQRQQPFSPIIFETLGLDPRTLDLIIVKSTNHFFNKFAPIVKEIIYCDAPGPATEDLTALTYRHLKRPVFPLDGPELCQQRLAATEVAHFPDPGHN